jgi:hypothetical protein
MDSGDSESTKCEIPFPAKKFSFGVFLLVQGCDVEILATGNCFLILSFHLFLSVLLRFVLLLGSVVLTF